MAEEKRAKRQKRKYTRDTRISERHLKMVDRYFANGFNKTEAARYVGYQHASAYISRLFEYPEVIEEVEKRRANMRKKFELDEEWVIERLMRIADAQLSDIMVIQDDGSAFFDLTKMTPEMAYAISEFSVDEYTEGRGDEARAVKRVKIKPSDKLAALNSLARHLGLFNDKLEVSGEMSLVERLQAGRKRVNKDENAENEE